MKSKARSGARLGIATDGDADRFGVVDETVLSSSRIM